MLVPAPSRVRLPRRAVTALVVAAVAVPLAGVSYADDSPASAPTELRISAPSSAPAGSTAPVAVRLVERPTSGRQAPVAGEQVDLQRASGSSWVQVARVTTGSDGLARTAVRVSSTARYRALFRGDTAHEQATSRQATVASRSSLGDRAVAEARRHQGQPYSYGAAGPSSFDCSGLTMYVFRRIGRDLPHNAAEQARVTRRIANSDKRPGDLIFGYHGSAIGHVGIYAGGTKMWAAVQSGDVVRLQDFSGRAYRVGRVG